MLVLARKTNQVVRIGTDIYLEVLSVKGNTVRLGFMAPQQCRILRGELYGKMPESLGRAADIGQATGDSPSALHFEATSLPNWLEEVVG